MGVKGSVWGTGRDAKRSREIPNPDRQKPEQRKGLAQVHQQPEWVASHLCLHCKNSAFYGEMQELPARYIYPYGQMAGR